ncbi:Cytochrome c-type biogenesis protein CcmE homolog, mitochondrial [Linum perenne]
MVVYVTPTDAMEQYKANPKKTKFRLGGLVLEGSVVQLSNSWLIQFSFHYFLYNSWQAPEKDKIPPPLLKPAKS